MTDPTMRRVLVSAYGCEPGKGSEQGVGWNWVRQLARHSEVWVVTRANNQESIEKCSGVVPCDGIRFVYYDLPPWLTRLKRRERGFYAYYLAWQVGAFLLARRLLRATRFDYSMHLTFGSLWLPTFFHLLPVPFVWGPVGGGEAVPPAFLRVLSPRQRMTQWLRALGIRTVRINPFVVLPARAAAAIIARTEESRDVFPPRFRSKVSVVLETGMTSPLALGTASPGAADLPVEFVYTGRLVGIKNLAMAIRAFSSASRLRPRLRLTIIGDGPERPALEHLAGQVCVGGSVRFLGERPRDAVLRALAQAHVFLFPSLKEGGTWSLMEAMAMGLPVICLNTTGMRLITDDACAYRIEPTGAAYVEGEMVRAIIELADDPLRRAAMGEAGLRRIRGLHSWDAKGDFLENLFGALDARSMRSRP